MSNNENYEIIIQTLVDFISSSNETEIKKEICKNHLIETQNNINEDEINNILNIIFEKEEIIQKQDALNKLSSFYQKEENENENEENLNNNNLDNINNYNDKDKEQNIFTKNSKYKELIKPKNKIVMPIISIKPHKITAKKNDSNNNEIKKEKRSFNKKPLAADKITYNKVDLSSKNSVRILDKINRLKNDFEIEKKMILPINKKPLVYENKVYNNNDNYYKNNHNYVKKNYKNEFNSKKFDLNDENQRKEYVNDIKSSLKNFAQEKKERENIFNQEENPFDNINEMLKQFKQKKKDEESNN